MIQVSLKIYLRARIEKLYSLTNHSQILRNFSAFQQQAREDLNLS
jgi:hypothetical protein